MPPYSSQSICRRCTAHLQWQRSFSTTLSRLAVGPESPSFIAVPEPKQAPKPPEPPVKGVLPRPRKLFGRGHGGKASIQYIQQATQKPKTRAKPHGPEAERLAWKQRMAESRRQNLKEGIRELMQRKQRTDRLLNTRSAARRDRHERKANMAARADEVLTNPTLHNSVRQILEGNIRSTSLSRENEPNKYLIEQAKKAGARKDQLHTFYTHARNFIVSEEALNAAVDKAFGSDEHPVRWGPSGTSVWALRQKPMGVGDMLNPDKVFQLQWNAETETVVQRRMKRIAEEFTGGRIAKDEQDKSAA